MGGTVGVKSVLGKGTTFTLSLPITDARVSQRAQQESEALKGTGTILIVDDDIRVRAFVYTALERLGYQVFEASHVSVAVEIARLHRDEIDLLLTDVVMDGGGGAAVIVAIRSEIPELPVLVMSGYANDEALRRGIVKGEFPFLAKPFTIERLGEAVQRALSQSAPKPSN
jgi:DNA-binding NtrC family response regulator